MSEAQLVIGRIAERILVLRSQRVIGDSELASLYGVETRALLQAVRRNARRFPSDFVFFMTKQEFASLRSQFVISRWGGRRSLPAVFTEHGAVMAASVLNSDRAIDVSVYVVRAFVHLRHAVAAHAAIADRIGELERKLGTHDAAIRDILEALRGLAAPPSEGRKKRIGFV